MAKYLAPGTYDFYSIDEGDYLWGILPSVELISGPPPLLRRHWATDDTEWLPRPVKNSKGIVVGMIGDRFHWVEKKNLFVDSINKLSVKNK